MEFYILFTYFRISKEKLFIGLNKYKTMKEKLFDADGLFE